MQAPRLRVAVIGAGISGLALAGILSNAKIEIHVDVFERASADRDEGYGLDFDYHGQKALKQAGVYHRFWEFSRPHSDIMQFYLLNQDMPLVTLFRPKILMKLFPSYVYPQPESNRSGYRQVMLESFQKSGKVKVKFDTKVDQILEYIDPSNGKQKVDLIADKEVLGRYDLVVDCSGVHSPFRHIRVDDSVGKHYSGVMMIHGAVYNPEASWPKKMIQKLGEGTLAVFSGGYRFVFQRFGAKPDDKRTAFLYYVTRPDENVLFTEIGIQKATSRKEGIIKDAENLGKIKNWLHKDMASISADFHSAVDSIDRLTVRPDFCHGDTQLKKNMPLPFVCIGDSMCCIGVGGGGNVCLQDVSEFSDTLLANIDATGQINFPKIRTLEEQICKRRNEFIKQKKLFKTSSEDRSGKMSLLWTILCVFITIISNTMVFFEKLFFGLGSPRPIKS